MVENRSGGRSFSCLFIRTCYFTDASTGNVILVRATYGGHLRAWYWRDLEPIFRVDDIPRVSRRPKVCILRVLRDRLFNRRRSVDRSGPADIVRRRIRKGPRIIVAVRPGGKWRDLRCDGGRSRGMLIAFDIDHWLGRSLVREEGLCDITSMQALQ
jgi:hypothetical protein